MRLADISNTVMLEVLPLLPEELTVSRHCLGETHVSYWLEWKNQPSGHVNFFGDGHVHASIADMIAINYNDGIIPIHGTWSLADPGLIDNMSNWLSVALQDLWIHGRHRSRLVG